MDKNTIRILSLDGGGVRGYLSLKFLQKFIQLWRIDGKDLWKYFDVIAGTSIGGIQALGYAYGKGPDELESFFREKSKRIFTIRGLLDVESCNTNYDSNRPSAFQKISFIVNNSPFYLPACPLPDGHSNYGSNILHEVLVENFGENTLQNLKTNVVVPAYQKNKSKYVMFSNYPDSMLYGANSKIVDVARATSAAPIYLPAHSVNSDIFADGGVYQNNPADIALSLAKAIKPRAKRSCILSLGTGIGKMGFQGDSTGSTSNDSAISEIFSLFNISSTGGQESIDLALKLQSKRSLERCYYYRFQPMLDQTINTELDNSDVSFLDYMERTANEWFTNDIGSITTFLGHLTV